MAFNILCIDGGGIRGVFPAKILEQLEAELQAKDKKNWQVYQHFDLICGTSTGGILAIALALGVPAKEIFELYIDNADTIFGNKRRLIFGQFRHSSHNREALEKLIREKFQSINNNQDPRLKDCKTSVCIPIYDLLIGKPSVLKTGHHPRFTRDYHIPAYQVALGTSAAPTYFDPYSTSYTDLNGTLKSFSNKVDGGVVANNPTLLGIIEAQTAFYQDLANINVLSLGTGNQKFTDGKNRKNWGIFYWMLKNKKRRIIDLFMQAQSQQTENLISLLQFGIDAENRENPKFKYMRINTDLDDTLKVDMDTTDKDILTRLAEKGSHEFHNNATNIMETYCNGRGRPNSEENVL